MRNKKILIGIAAAALLSSPLPPAQATPLPPQEVHVAIWRSVVVEPGNQTLTITARNRPCIFDVTTQTNNATDSISIFTLPTPPRERSRTFYVRIPFSRHVPHGTYHIEGVWAQLCSGGEISWLDGEYGEHIRFTVR